MKRRERHRTQAEANLGIPDLMPPAIIRPREHIQAVLAQSVIETGSTGRAALAWAWALSGTRPSPITLSLAPGRPPPRETIQAGANAEPEAAVAPSDVPADYYDQIGEARRILTWLIGASDDIPLDDEQRGRFIGAYDDSARTDTDIRHVLNQALCSLASFDLPESMDPADAANPWRWEPRWMNAAWHRGVRDLLAWVLGDRAASPLSGRANGRPTVYDLTYEDSAASDVIAQSRPGGPPPQYGEAIQATITWLRGETTTPPVGPNGEEPYQTGA